MSPGREQELGKQVKKIEHLGLRPEKTRLSYFTYKAAIRISRLLFWTLLRERHTFTSAHAPTASNDVHRSVGCIRDVGTIVEKRDNASGDCMKHELGTAAAA